MREPDHRPANPLAQSAPSGREPHDARSARHPGEAVNEDREECAVAKPRQIRHVDAVEEGTGFLCREDGGLCGLDDVLRAPDRARGVERQDLAGDEPVKEHPQRREVLLDGRG